MLHFIMDATLVGGRNLELEYKVDKTVVLVGKKMKWIDSHMKSTSYNLNIWKQNSTSEYYVKSAYIALQGPIEETDITFDRCFWSIPVLLNVADFSRKVIETTTHLLFQYKFSYFVLAYCYKCIVVQGWPVESKSHFLQHSSGGFLGKKIKTVGMKSFSFSFYACSSNPQN
ncbi:hypothetical protein CR513_36104, partial [Mucuna pruriens]